MQVLGRILQFIGWLWVAAGFFGPMLNLPFDLNFFPGIILVFVARIIRAQAARKAGDGLEATDTSEAVRQPVEVKRRPETEPERQQTPEPRPVDKRNADAEAKRKQMLEQVLLSGTEVAAQTAPSTPEPEPESEPEVDARDYSGTTGPMSSAEMIAQARKRWNKN